MCIALNLFSFGITSTMLFSAVLPVSTNIGGCEQPSSASKVQMYVAF